MTSYYRRFIKDYASIAEPLVRLTRSDSPLDREELQQVAFDDLNNRLVTTPIVAHYDPLKPVTLVTDASAVGVGAVCLQSEGGEKRVVAYASTTLNKTRNYGATELELYAVVFAIEKFHCYIANGIGFTVIADHSAITAL